MTRHHAKDPSFSAHYGTDEGGEVSFVFYFMEKDLPDDETKTDLKILSDIMFIECGRWRLAGKLKTAYMTDGLTGLSNTGGYLVNAEKLAKRGELKNYNSFYFNLSHFGLVNLRFGNHEADTIIKRYVQKLLSLMKNGECLGRLGGDNFVALIFKEHTEDFLKLLSGIETYGMIGDEKIPLTISASAGVSRNDENTNVAESVISDAAVALNEARFVRKCPYVFVDKEMREKVFRKKKLIEGFGKAIKNRDFLVYYQPKVRAEDGSLIGAEALSRLKAGRNILMPGSFIPVFEQNGMIRTLDFYVLDQVCRDIASWTKAGIKPVKVSVNFSRKHLGEDALSERIFEVIDRYHVDHNLIEIEVTETVDRSESSYIAEFITELRKNGIAVSIDDFGSGYSSLNMLREFPVDVVKLDKEFITSLDERDRKVIVNVIHMIDDLDMMPIAEGVETLDQLEYLTSVGCRMFQGFLFDKPIPEADFEERLKKGGYDLDFLNSLGRMPQ